MWSVLETSQFLFQFNSVVYLHKMCSSSMLSMSSILEVSVVEVHGVVNKVKVVHTSYCINVRLILMSCVVFWRLFCLLSMFLLTANLCLWNQSLLSISEQNFHWIPRCCHCQLVFVYLLCVCESFCVFGVVMMRFGHVNVSFPDDTGCQWSY